MLGGTQRFWLSPVGALKDEAPRQGAKPRGLPCGCIPHRAHHRGTPRANHGQAMGTPRGHLRKGMTIVVRTRMRVCKKSEDETWASGCRRGTKRGRRGRGVVPSVQEAGRRVRVCAHNPCVHRGPNPAPAPKTQEGHISSSTRLLQRSGVILFCWSSAMNSNLAAVHTYRLGLLYVGRSQRPVQKGFAQHRQYSTILCTF